MPSTTVKLTRAYLHSLHRGRNTILSGHAKTSTSILSKVSKLLDKKGLLYTVDESFPFHLIVYINKYSGRLSVYAGGFSNIISIMPLRTDGSPYSNSYYEKSYLTPEGAVNYIKRKYNKVGGKS